MLPTPDSLLKLPVGAHEIGKCFLNRIIIIKSCNLMILVPATREPINSRTKQKHKPHSRLWCSQLYYDGMSTYCSQAVLYRAKALSQPSFIFGREMGDLLKRANIHRNALYKAKTVNTILMNLKVDVWQPVFIIITAWMRPIHDWWCCFVGISFSSVLLCF